MDLRKEYLKVSKMNTELVFEEPAFPKISGDDPYIWVDFKKEFAFQTFDSYDHLYNRFVEQFPRVAASIENSSGHFIKKDTTEAMFNRVKDIRLNMMYQIEATKGKKNSSPGIEGIKLGVLLEDAQREGKIPLYSTETFKPMDYDVDEKEFNTWTGFKADIKAERDDGYDTSKVHPMMDFIKEIISARNDDVYKYTLTWLHHTVAKPWMKTGVALFLQSDDQGTGKGSFGHWLRNHLYGNHISIMVNGLSKLVQKHNNCIDKKLFVMVDELPHNAGEFHKEFDCMKNLITDPVITIEPKGIDPFQIPNYANFMMMSNNSMSLKVESGDRRYACFEVSNARKGDTDYWEYMHKNVFTAETAKHFFRYLMAMDEKDLVDLGKIPKTALRERLISCQSYPHARFFDELKSGEYVPRSPFYLEKFEHKEEIIGNAVTADVLYMEYRYYCDIGHEPSPLRKKLFFDAIRDKVVQSIAKINRKTTRVYRVK